MGEKCILDPERDCLGLIKANKLEQEFADFKERNDKSHKEYYDRLAVIETHNQVQDAHYEHIIDKLTDITDRLSQLSNKIAAIELKPAKKWDGVMEKITLTIVGAVIGYFLIKLGVGG